MNQQEIDKITSAVIEEVLVRMPKVIGNLMQHHATVTKLNHKFYSANPNFQQHKDVVVSVIEQVESKDISLKYEDILTQATPIIKKRISMLGAVNTLPELSNKFPRIVSEDLKDNGVL